MGKLLMPATVFESVANQLSQLSQPRTTLRQCASCPYPFRDRAPTGALLQRGLLAQNRSVANRSARRDLEGPLALRSPSRGWRFPVLLGSGRRTGMGPKFTFLQIDVLTSSICTGWCACLEGGFSLAPRGERKPQGSPILDPASSEKILEHTLPVGWGFKKLDRMGEPEPHGEPRG